MFSVVIPLYNKSHVILRTLASVVTQTFTDFEVIIVNDGSTDNSLELIRPFTSDPRIRIIEQENQGVSAARNKGVSLARFDYIAFLDADDEWLPGYLQKMQEAISLFPDAGMYGCPSWHRNILNGESGDASLDRYRNKIQVIEYFENPHTMPHTSAMIVSRQLFLQIDDGNGFPAGMKCCEDWSCFNRMAFLAPFVYVGYTLGIKNNGVFGQITGTNTEERFKLLCFVVDFYNLTHDFSQKYSHKAELFGIFFRYDLRNRVLCSLREKDYQTIDYLFAGLDQECLNELSGFEKWIYTSEKMNFIAKLYVYGTKLMWRTHGFPVLGKAN